MRIFLFIFLITYLNGWAQLSKDPKAAVMMQGFWWKSYNDSLVKKEGGLYVFLKNRAPELSKSGIDMVWTPPPSDGDEMGYFPKELFKFSNLHGTEQELKNMLRDFKKHRLHAMADVIFNHRNGSKEWADFTNPYWDCSTIVEDDEIKSVPGQLVPCSGENDEGEGFTGARDVNHKKIVLQKT